MSRVIIDESSEQPAATHSGERQWTKELINEQGIETVEVAFTDTQGVLRGKRLPTKAFLESSRKRFPFCNAALIWDYRNDLVDTGFSNWAGGFPDFYAVPDFSTFKILPWRRATAVVLSDLVAHSGAEVEYSTRYLLKHVIAEVEKLGLKTFIGGELEFYLLNIDGSPLYDEVQAYSLNRAATIDPFLDHLREKLSLLFVDLEAGNTEYGPAQIEINLRYTDALRAADNLVLFKYAVKSLAAQYGLLATFMSKPFAQESGSGLHIHQSLWPTQGPENQFNTDSAHPVFSGYLAGLIKYSPELTLFQAPTINSYKRFRPLSFAPTNATWGEDNRTTAIRLVRDSETGVRLENRIGAADSNPYLAIAANLIAGLEGIKQGLKPTPETDGNGYDVTSAARLPGSLKEAIEITGQSQVARTYLGHDFVTDYLALCSREVELFNQAVTDWESDRYLRLL